MTNLGYNGCAPACGDYMSLQHYKSVDELCKVDLENYQYLEGSATVNALKEQVGGNHYSK